MAKKKYGNDDDDDNDDDQHQQHTYHDFCIESYKQLEKWQKTT